MTAYIAPILMAFLTGCVTTTPVETAATRPPSTTDRVESLTKTELRSHVPVDSAIFEVTQTTVRFGTQAFSLRTADHARKHCFFRSCYGGLTLEQPSMTEAIADYTAPRGNFVPPYSALVRVTPWTNYAELTVLIAAILQARPLEIWLRVGEQPPHKILSPELLRRAQVVSTGWF